jgi:hypothetical protein
LEPELEAGDIFVKLTLFLVPTVCHICNADTSPGVPCGIFVTLTLLSVPTT